MRDGLLAVVCGLAIVGMARADGDGGLGGGGPIESGAGACVSDAERAEVLAVIEDTRRRQGAALGAPPRFPFYPMAGRMYEDVFLNAFADLQDGGGIEDFECTARTYNGHRGNDNDIRGFAEQLIGVPVYAGADGTVIDTHDGEFDMNTSCVGLANYVIIEHDGGRVSWYFHLQNGSVAVNVGDDVVAGQHIGNVGSSGCSGAPHLHFEVWDGDDWVEPHAGPCRPGVSLFEDQVPLRTETYLSDFGITHIDLNGVPGYPYDPPRSHQIETGDWWVYYWFSVKNLPADSTWRWQFDRPDGTTALDTGDGDWNNAFYPSSWWWFSWHVDDMGVITGTWTVRFFINGEVVVEAPFEVVDTRDPAFNRAPYAVTPSFDPAPPAPGEIVVCSLDTSLVHDDPDYDLTSYRYEWTVNGGVIRDVTIAAQADVIPGTVFVEGDEICVTVTPTDGLLDGPSAQVCATAVTPCPGDVDGSGAVDVGDMLAVLAAWGPCGACPADIDGSGVVDVADMLAILAAWGPC